MARNILIVDDDRLLRRSLAFHLEQAGYHASTSANAEEALDFARVSPPDLVILDIGLPGMDGLNALRRFKEALHVPVIFLTARSRKIDEIVGLELGADDYITKPFDSDVLISHIKAVLRRDTYPTNHSAEQIPIEVGDLRIDPGSHTVTIGKQPVILTFREFHLLYILALNAGQVVTINELLSQIWGADCPSDSHLIYVHIRWLREKIEVDPDHPRRIITIRRVGYKLVAQEGPC